MNKIKMCIFDMDGILLDSETIYLINAKKCSELYNFNVTDEVLNAIMGANEKQIRNIFHKYLGNDFPYDDFVEKEYQIQDEYMKENPLELEKGVLELLDYLTDKKIVKVIATSTSRDYACKCLKDAKIYDYFDYIVCGDDLEKSKPDPDIYLKAKSPYDYKADEILVFEDSNNGILSGYNAGLNVVYVPDVAIVEEETKKKAYATINDLNEAISLIESINNK